MQWTDNWSVPLVSLQATTHADLRNSTSRSAEHLRRLHGEGFVEKDVVGAMQQLPVVRLPSGAFRPFFWGVANTPGTLCLAPGDAPRLQGLEGQQGPASHDFLPLQLERNLHQDHPRGAPPDLFSTLLQLSG
jgi:hypothetical protein